ncbi:MAG: hypothetical protein ACFFED_08830 [Candidatus Thorarchaeota archaeon]
MSIYIPLKQTPRLVQIQFSTLPEDEWIIGISDLAYFQGIGFSLPIPFDERVKSVTYDALLRSSDFDLQNESINKIDLIIDEDSRDLVPSDDLLDMNSDSLIESSEWTEKGFPIPIANVSVRNLEDMGMGSNKLYAFLPGIFYCSKHDEIVDGVLIEVLHRNIFDQTFASFQPEYIASFDIQSGLVEDEDGEIRETGFDMALSRRFTTGINKHEFETIDADSMIQGSFRDVAYSKELDVAKRLSARLSIDDLKKAYVSDSIVMGQLITLLHDIERRKIIPRNKIYITNSHFPSGKVVDVVYKGLDIILELSDDEGILLPLNLEISAEIGSLSFAKLIGHSKEVDIERAVLDMYQCFEKEVGHNPSMDDLAHLIFGGIV